MSEFRPFAYERFRKTPSVSATQILVSFHANVSGKKRTNVKAGAGPLLQRPDGTRHWASSFLLLVVVFSSVLILTMQVRNARLREGDSMIDSPLNKWINDANNLCRQSSSGGLFQTLEKLIFFLPYFVGTKSVFKRERRYALHLNEDIGLSVGYPLADQWPLNPSCHLLGFYTFRSQGF